MTPRTILLAAPYFPPDLGGVEQYVLNLARLLQSRHGHRVVIATTALRGTMKPGRYDGPDGIPVYRLAAPTRLSHTPIGLQWSRRLRGIIDEEGVDLVNGHAPVPLFADAAARASGDLPFVLTYHTGRMRKGRILPDLFCATYERTMLARTAARAEEIVCSSDYVATDLPHLFAGRSTTISPGVHLSEFPASPVPEAPRIVFVGSLERSAAHKGLPDLLRAVGLLTRTFPAVHLEVVGAGTGAAEHEALARRLGLARHVTFRGRLDGEALAAAYSGARVLALPTRFDSFPCVLVEAMASGRPVVTTRVGGIPSLVTHGGNGLLVEPEDEACLAEALGSVLGDRVLAQRLGSAGHEHVARELSWERQSDRTAEVFDRAANRGGRRVRTVAVVAPNYPPRCGGVEHYAARVAHAVAEDPAMRAAVITASTTGWRTSVCAEDDMPVVRLGTWARHLNTPVSPLWPLQLRCWLRRLRVDVVNAHAPAPGLGDLAVLLSGKRPTVLTYHAGSMLQGHRDVDLLVRAYERHVLPRVFSRASALVASSPVSLAFDRPGAVEISPGVDVDRFTPGPPASTRPRTVVYVGRLDRASPWKGVDVLLRAFAGLSDMPEARLRLVGGGDALAEHRALAERLGITDRVEFTGRVPGETLLDALRSAAVLVLPSRTAAESFGMVLVEAMACGTPVVGSDAGGIPYVITHGATGLLFPRDVPDALAAACQRLLRDGEFADRLGAAGRRCAVERYAWPTRTDRYLRLFRSLISQSGTPVSS
ncbi:glycosyltransferase family 4 protein [Streptomyces swartbergensis]|uniref:glycosyltransferase family 4 protein n=1 Tax=Streptomyces swartbergensis TaxID=487165 RepID=UPI003813DB0B